MVVEDRVSAAYPLVRILARKFGTLPPGVTADDLESAGGEAVMEASANFDGDPAGWLKFARVWVRNAMRNVVRAARQRATRTRPLEVETADGDRLPRRDDRAEEPREVAARREGQRRGAVAVCKARLTSVQTPADRAAEKAAALREAMFSAVAAADVAAVMRAMVERAKGGDVKAAKLLVDMVRPSAGTTVNTVVVPPPIAG